MEERLVCVDCVDDYYLKSKIYLKPKGKCFYCKKIEKVTTVGEIAEYTNEMFKKYYKKQTTHDNNDKTEFVVIRKDGENVRWIIEEHAGVKSKIAKDIQNSMKKDNSNKTNYPYGKHARYSLKKHNVARSGDLWGKLEECVNGKSEPGDKEEILNLVFSKKSAFVKIDPESKYRLYRARRFQSEEKMIYALSNLEEQLGPPPPSSATAGRLNKENAPIFYGAEDLDTAISEVRPFVGSIVIVACFNVIRSIKLFDIGALEIGIRDMSFYDPSYVPRTEEDEFVFNLIRNISTPVLPKNEVTDYLVTQYIAEYLSKIGIDGIIYRSTQSKKGGNNVALFDKSSRIKRRHDIKASNVEIESYHHKLEHRVKFKLNRRKTAEPHDEVDAMKDNNFTSSLALDDSNLYVNRITGSNYGIIKEKVEVKMIDE